LTYPVDPELKLEYKVTHRWPELHLNSGHFYSYWYVNELREYEDGLTRLWTSPTYYLDDNPEYSSMFKIAYMSCLEMMNVNNTKSRMAGSNRVIREKTR